MTAPVTNLAEARAAVAIEACKLKRQILEAWARQLHAQQDELERSKTNYLH